jgi:hypothetical protein
MNTKNLCSESEAITLAGVSARTLSRFCEAGYITTQTSSDGSTLYNRSQIEGIFGLSASVAEDTRSAEASRCNLSEDAATHCGEEVAAEAGDNGAANKQAEDRRVHSAFNYQTDYSESKTSFAGSEARLHNEIERLRNLLAIQERILDNKDDEIADLKNQRSWLRERIEKLEEKADRDQILLLSETQTIRSLIAYRETKKSPVKQFLEWIGVSQPVQALPASPNYELRDR